MVYKAYREGRAEGVERRRIANAKEKRVKKQKNMQKFLFNQNSCRGRPNFLSSPADVICRKRA